MASLTGLRSDVLEAARYALAIAEAWGLSVTVTSGYRSMTKQVQLRAQYEACLRRGARIYPQNPDTRCRFPANRPGDSSHNYGLSFDSWVPEAQWPAWNYIRRAIGFRVPDNDRVHAEYPDWRSQVG